MDLYHFNDYLIIILSFSMIILIRFTTLKDKNKSITRYGLTLILIAIIMLLCKGCDIHRKHEREAEISNILMQNAKDCLESTKPEFQIVKSEVLWKFESFENQFIQLCLKNNGCRKGKSIFLKSRFYFIKDGEKIITEPTFDHTGIYNELINSKINQEKCCLEIKLDSLGNSLRLDHDMVMEIEAEYLDNKTGEKYEIHEYFHQRKNESHHDKLDLGLPSDLFEVIK